jgi:glycosyltransferase involved in cell wall biosynthesis
VHPGVELESFGVAIAARGRPGTGGPGATVLHIADRAPRGERARAVDLVGALHGLGVRARLRVVGRLDAGEAADLTARAAGAGVADALELAGERGDVPRLLVDAALLVVTSAGAGEGLPGAVLAAAAVGTPVLATESPELTELAALLPGITTLPRAASAAAWASAAADLLAVPPTPDDRWEALRRLRRSSFTRDRWERAVTAAWS